MDNPRRLRVINAPHLAGDVAGEGPTYITIEVTNAIEHVTRSPEAFEPAPPAGPSVEDLTAALRAILPYARSRLEDMEEHLKAVIDAPHGVGAEAEADVRKARLAFQLAEEALR